MQNGVAVFYLNKVYTLAGQITFDVAKLWLCSGLQKLSNIFFPYIFPRLFVALPKNFAHGVVVQGNIQHAVVGRDPLSILDVQEPFEGAFEPQHFVPTKVGGNEDGFLYPLTA